MKRLLVGVGLAALTLASLRADERQARVLMQAAEARATVQGDLKGAIAAYQDAVKEAGANRALAAQALMRMAECYQKLGDVESRKIYERLVREYADQKEMATLAQARLGGSAAVVSTKGDRAVWTGRDVDMFGTVSPDGRLLSFVDWGGMGNVVLRDLVSGVNRPLTPNTRQGEFGWGGFSAISRQGDRIAFEWQYLDGLLEVRIASLAGTGVPPFRVIRSTGPNTRTVTPKASS